MGSGGNPDAALSSSQTPKVRQMESRPGTWLAKHRRLLRRRSSEQYVVAMVVYQRVSGQESKSSTTRKNIIALYGVKTVGETQEYHILVLDLTLEESSPEEDKPTKHASSKSTLTNIVGKMSKRGKMVP